MPHKIHLCLLALIVLGFLLLSPIAKPAGGKDKEKNAEITVDTSSTPPQISVDPDPVPVDHKERVRWKYDHSVVKDMNLSWKGDSPFALPGCAAGDCLSVPVPDDAKAGTYDYRIEGTLKDGRTFTLDPQVIVGN
jgi:hypothetical protein